MWIVERYPNLSIFDKYRPDLFLFSKLQYTPNVCSLLSKLTRNSTIKSHHDLTSISHLRCPRSLLAVVDSQFSNSTAPPGLPNLLNCCDGRCGRESRRDCWLDAEVGFRQRDNGGPLPCGHEVWRKPQAVNESSRTDKGPVGEVAEYASIGRRARGVVEDCRGREDRRKETGIYLGAGRTKNSRDAGWSQVVDIGWDLHLRMPPQYMPRCDRR
jgi:hypothetical protein